MFSLTTTNNRMLIRLLISSVCLILFFFNSVPCFASELESVESGEVPVEEIMKSYSDEETDVATESEVALEVATDEVTVSSGDNLQTVETTAENNLSYETLNNIYDVLIFIAGILIFFVVVLLCKYSYKFFNIFF